jgi:hypothetical protein
MSHHRLVIHPQGRSPLRNHLLDSRSQRQLDDDGSEVRVPATALAFLDKLERLKPQAGQYLMSVDAGLG